MKKFVAAFVLLSTLFSSASACLNYYYMWDSEGHFHSQEGGLMHFNVNFNKKRIVSKLGDLEKKLAKEHAYTLLSDYAVGLMKLGKAKEAREILAELYSHYPNEYRLASNLGTAYELTGEVDSALKYIRRGLELNPNDHEGSEWVHVSVLETKQKLQKDPDYLKNHTVLQLTEAQKKDPKLRDQIEIQVRERFPFSPGPDAIMASLMTDLGDTYAQNYSVEYAKSFYDLAREYFGDTSDRVAQKSAEMKKLISKFSSKEMPQGPHPEGTYNKLGSVRYKHLLDDNDKDRQVVDWSKTNSDVNALLAYVDLTQTPQTIRDADKNATDSLRLTPDETAPENAAAEALPQTSQKSNALLYGAIAGGALLLLLVYGLYRFRKRS